MHLEVRVGDGSPSESDGNLYFVDQDLAAPVGAFVMSGDDTDPPTRHTYDAELLAVQDGLVVHLRQYDTHRGERRTCFVSGDAGRSWRIAALDWAPPQGQRLHQICGRLEPNLLGPTG